VGQYSIFLNNEEADDFGEAIWLPDVLRCSFILLL
jgi:hypothetical protein